MSQSWCQGRHFAVICPISMPSPTQCIKKLFPRANPYFFAVKAANQVKPVIWTPKYFKMVNFGVPKPVVIMKFQQETGFDPALLDTPDAPAPLGGEDEDDADDDED